MIDDFPRVNVLGVAVHAVTVDDVLAAMAGWIVRGERRYVCVTPAHTVMDCRRDPQLRRLVNQAGLVTPDGMAIVWLLRLHGQRRARRVYGPDLLAAACARSLETGWRHFFCGGAPGVAERLAARLQQRFPGLAVVGFTSPAFRALSQEEDRDLVAAINATHPDIVWVGLGSPKQERWMGEHVGQLKAPVMVGVGAAFDYLSGNKRQAPVWVQRSGLEWLFRWASEPRRLTPRYLRYPAFAALVAAQCLGLRRFPLE